MSGARARTSARVDPVQAAVDAIPTEAIHCRRLRSHDWHDAGETVVPGLKRGEALVTERCNRGCRVGRRAWWNLDTGEQLSPWVPDYPDGYLIPGGLPDEARRNLQRDYLRRFLP